MRDTITAALVKDLRKARRAETVFDDRQPGLMLRVLASGTATYRVQLGRGKFLKLGLASDLTPEKARRLAAARRGDVAEGKDPIAERRKARAATLEAFLDGAYGEWAAANQRHAAEWIARVKRCFPELLAKPLPAITAWHLEKWRTARHQAGVRATTTNRELDLLRSVLSRAREWGLLDDHPMTTVKRATVDTIGRLRFLSPDEEKRLRAALQAREQRNRDGRASFNRWRAERGYKTLPDYGTYTDHLQPLVLLALNSGLRRGELLALRWSDVDQAGAQLTVRGATSKTGRTRRVPLNTEALAVFGAWQPAGAAGEALVFPGPQGEVMEDVKTAWGKLLTAASIEHFTFHDLRHTFASRLVQAGVDLNTVRELLGHADIKMTLRYAHLAPEHRAAAVARLVSAG